MGLGASKLAYPAASGPANPLGRLSGLARGLGGGVGGAGLDGTQGSVWGYAAADPTALP